MPLSCTENNQYYTNKGTPAAPNWVIVRSQWLTDGSNIYYAAGNVGIGVSPAYPLHFASNIGDKISLFGSGAYHYGIGIQDFQLQIHSQASSSDIVFGYGCSSALTETMRIKGNGQVCIGTASPATSAALDVTGTSRGFLPPRMDHLQRNAIVNPVAGLVVWCNNCGETGELQVYNGTAWTNMVGGSATPGIGIGDTYQGGKIATYCNPATLDILQENSTDS